MVGSHQKEDETYSRFAGAVLYGCIVLGLVAVAFVGDAVDRQAKILPLWLWLAIGVGGGLVLGIPLASSIDTSRARQRQEKKRIAEAAAHAQQLKLWEEQQAARSLAVTGLPNMLDEDILLDVEGDHCWPKDLFKNLFEIPDVVVPYTLSDGTRSEIRFWSRDYVGVQEKDTRYQRHKAKVNADRARWRREEEEEQARLEQDRLEAEERQRRLDAIVSIPLTELQIRKVED